MADATLEGLEQRLAAFRVLPAKIQAAAEAQLDQEAKDLAEAVRRAVPVKTGTLRDTIEVKAGDDPTTRTVVAGGKATTVKVRQGVKDADFAKALETGGSKGEYDYARGVEFGHLTPEGEHIGPRPFFFATFRARKKAMVRRLKAAARKAIKAEFPQSTPGA